MNKIVPIPKGKQLIKIGSTVVKGAVGFISDGYKIKVVADIADVSNADDVRPMSDLESD